MLGTYFCMITSVKLNSLVGVKPITYIIDTVYKLNENTLSNA
jgi:hypothetical protein